MLSSGDPESPGFGRAGVPIFIPQSFEKALVRRVWASCAACEWEAVGVGPEASLQGSGAPLALLWGVVARVQICCSRRTALRRMLLPGSLGTWRNVTGRAACWNEGLRIVLGSLHEVLVRVSRDVACSCCLDRYSELNLWRRRDQDQRNTKVIGKRRGKEAGSVDEDVT
jgi:hypothetical protein